MDLKYLSLVLVLARPKFFSRPSFLISLWPHHHPSTIRCPSFVNYRFLSCGATLAHDHYCTVLYSPSASLPNSDASPREFQSSNMPPYITSLSPATVKTKPSSLSSPLSSFARIYLLPSSEHHQWSPLVISHLLSLQWVVSNPATMAPKSVLNAT
jgi:hypothetical protein